MSQVTTTARIDTSDKAAFEEFCSDVGLNTSTAINLFIKAILREKRIPFEIAKSKNPAYSASAIRKDQVAFEGAAEEMGIKSEDDIQALVDEVRHRRDA